MYTEENPKSRDRMSITELFMAILLAIILLVFTVPFKNRDYIFDWDQGNDYEATAKIAGGKLALIGPRVTSDSGFFLAPWHYYFLLPFYKLTGGSLDMGFWAALTIQYLWALTAFLLVKKWWGSRNIISDAGECGGMGIYVCATIKFNIFLCLLKNIRESQIIALAVFIVWFWVYDLCGVLCAGDTISICGYKIERRD